MNMLPTGHPLTGPTRTSPVIRAYRGHRPPTTPVWFMRQAGRSLPEYRRLRTGTRMLQACQDPELVTEITLQPVRRHGVDAAILFSDIVVPLAVLGVAVDIVPGKGPVLEAPVRTADDVARLRSLTAGGIDPQIFAPIAAAVQALTSELGSTPLIGFSGAPYTLAAYLIEGGPSKDHLRARAMMHAEPELWDDLLSWIADVAGAFLSAQVRAGASAAQLFDSWAGELPLADYTAHVAPHSARALAPVRALRVPRREGAAADEDVRRAGRPDDASADRVDDASVRRTEGPDDASVRHAGEAPATTAAPAGTIAHAAAAPGDEHGDGAATRVPTVHFGVGTGHLLPAMHAVGVDTVGVDWRTPLDEAAAAVPGVPLQGNVNPALLAAPWPVLIEHVTDVLHRGQAAPAHVLNLGHGVPPDTDPEVLTRIVAAVHDGDSVRDGAAASDARPR